MRKRSIIFGISGYSLSREEIELFQTNIDRISGFILFSRNIKSRDQLIALTDSLKSLSPHIKIFTDQEGGRVARAKPPITLNAYPSAEQLSLEYQQDKQHTKQKVKDNYSSLMSELKSLGIDSPCAPTCDIRYDGANDVIGDRSFGSNALQVIDLCKSAIDGILEANGIPFIKHIPGHGRALLDSHFDLPVVDASLEELEKSDFRVFKELAKKEKIYGMSAHIIYKALDDKIPATISYKAIKYIRNKIGFTGILVSDDICMYALHGEVGQKHSVLERVIKLVENNKEWRSKHIKSFRKLFDIDINTIKNDSIIELCHNKLEEIKPQFIESLSKVAKMALDARCDTILHCSGNIDEIRAISRVLDNNFV